MYRRTKTVNTSEAERKKGCKPEQKKDHKKLGVNYENQQHNEEIPEVQCTTSAVKVHQDTRDIIHCGNKWEIRTKVLQNYVKRKTENNGKLEQKYYRTKCSEKQKITGN